MQHTYEGEANPRSMFVEGPFGSGKTTFAIETLITWLSTGIPAENILVMVPQRTLAKRFYEALNRPALGALGTVSIVTLGGLAQDVVQLYWPLVAKAEGFTDPDREPRYLTIETAQYAMASFVETAWQNGEFDAVNVSPQQIARQVIDNLGKAAIRRIPYQEIPALLAAAWPVEREKSRKRILAYQAAGRVAQAYREYCKERRLLDYAYQIELFNRLLDTPGFRADFFKTRTHLIAEHMEEESPLGHDLIRAWLPHLDGALLTYELDGGYRVFLGADADGGYTLKDECEGVLTLPGSQVMTPPMQALEKQIAISFRRETIGPPPDDMLNPGFSFEFHSYYPQMIDWVVERIHHLVRDEGVPPREIVILAPYLSDALRFQLSRKLAARDIKAVSHRPSRALRDEPAARAMLTLSALVYGEWGYRPPRADVADALYQVIDALDPVRARLLAEIVYRPGADEPLSPFEKIKPEMQARITYAAGESYEALRTWLMDYRAADPAPLDHLFNRLFGERLSQEGYGFHSEPEAGRIIAELVESAQKFRQALYPGGITSPGIMLEVGKRYYSIVQQGLLAALYITSWQDEQADAVYMVPAYTFLMRNRSAKYQFWLDVGSVGWWERLDQPLTHPYVLAPGWEFGRVWTDRDEYEHQQDMLYRLMIGLVRRCQDHIYLGISDLGEQGFEQRGPMLRVFQGILKRTGGIEEVTE